MLSEKYVQIAKNELREDESRKTQSLQQFRELIDKHPYIRNCRTDDIFLLRYLRTKKYSVANALTMLEKGLISARKYPEWYKNLDANDIRLMSLLDSGYIVPLMKKDQSGRQVIFSSLGRFDTEKFKIEDSIRLNTLIYNNFMEDEDVQIAGYVQVVDGINLSMNVLSFFSLRTFKDWYDSVEKAAPIRIRKYHLVNFPSFANTILNWVLNLLSAKLRNRVCIHKDYKELADKLDMTIFPQEIGGKMLMTAMIKHFKQRLQKNRDIILSNDMMDILTPKCMEWFENSNLNEGASGSFRKIEFD